VGSVTRATLLVAAGVLLVGAAGPPRREQPARTVWDGVYTEAQAKRGAALYDVHCASCHGLAGAGGGLAPALVGSAFAANYDGLTVADLFERNRRTMPVGEEGTLSREQTADITAYMLQCNGFPAGKEELPSDVYALRGIAYLATKPR
jgi:mono/diheme cytochrome c family protein